MKHSDKSFDFEQSLNALQATVEQLESGDLSLEQALSAFETGIGLTRDCQQALDQARQRINLLLEQDGEPRTRPLESAHSPNEPGDDIPF